MMYNTKTDRYNIIRITFNMPVFQTELDIVFEKILELYGQLDKENVMKYKEELLDTYQNEEKRRCAKLLKLIKPRHFHMDVEGNIRELL